MNIPTSVDFFARIAIIIICGVMLIDLEVEFPSDQFYYLVLIMIICALVWGEKDEY